MVTGLRVPRSGFGQLSACRISGIGLGLRSFV